MGSKKYFLFLLLVLLSKSVRCQTVDTLAYARELHLAGKTRSAAQLLNRWTNRHPSDANALWLAGQNEYWRKNFRKTRTHFRNALQLDPKNLYLNLDFADMLLGMGRFRQAQKVLDNIPKAQRNDAHFQYINAKKMFWAGDLANAAKRAQAAQKAGSLYAPKMLREIERARSLQVSMRGNYATDTQSIEHADLGMEALLPKNKWLDMRFQAIGQRFQADSLTLSTTQFAIANHFHFPKMGTVLSGSAGLFQKKSQKLETTTNLELTQRLPLGLKMALSVAREPYLYTRSSLDTSLFYRRLSGEIEWIAPKNLWAKIGGQADFFDDNNQIRTLWAWILSPPLKTGWISARVGYSYSFSDAQESRFFSQKTLQELLSPWDSTAQIQGRYAYYFTPEKMKTHAALGILAMDFTKSMSIIIHGKYGFFASAANPYLYLDADTNSLVFINRAFINTHFTPIELGVKWIVRFSSRFSAEANWVFTRNFFYEHQTAELRLKCIF